VKSKERNLPATPQKSLSVSNAWKGSRKEKERFSENEIVEVGPGTKMVSRTRWVLAQNRFRLFSQCKSQSVSYQSRVKLLTAELEQQR